MWARAAAGLATGAAISWFAFWRSWTSHPHGGSWLWLVLPGIYVLEGVNRLVRLPDEVNFVLILVVNALLCGGLVTAILSIVARVSRKGDHSNAEGAA